MNQIASNFEFESVESFADQLPTPVIEQIGKLAEQAYRFCEKMLCTWPADLTPCIFVALTDDGYHVGWRFVSADACVGDTFSFSDGFGIPQDSEAVIVHLL